MKKRKILGYVILVDALGILAFALAAPYRIADPWIGTFVLCTLVALAGVTPVRIPGLKTAVSATDPFVFVALAAYGPMVACTVGAAGVLGAAVARERDRRPLHLSFNLGNLVIAAALGSLAYGLAGGTFGAPLATLIWPLAAGTAVYFLTNTGLVAGAVSLDLKRGFFGAWREQWLWTAISASGGLTLAVCLLWALQSVGPTGLALGIPPCWLLATFYRTHKERQERQQERIEHVEVINQELEDKVAERTLELQQALERIEEANRQLVDTNERLLEANRAKSEFLANVSHELRTPLNAIIGFSDLLKDSGFGELTSDQTEFVRDIHESGEHLLGLINNILDLSKVEAGKLEARPEDCDVLRMIREGAAMVHPQAVKKGLTVRVEATEQVRQATLDPGMFRQVLINLLSNAVKFTPNGGRVTIQARSEGTDLRLTVTDTGIGIAPGDLANIFSEFYQVDGSYSRNYEGTGLGLALVRRILHLQGGEISVTSALGRGSSFTCHYRDVLRAGRSAAAEESSGQSSASAMDPVEEPSAELQRSRESELPPQTPLGETPKVLVVEDNSLNRKLARNVLKANGYEVLEAHNGEVALLLLSSERPDLVLMDVQLPGMDGLEITRRLRQDPANRDLPIVALTAHAQQEDEARALEAGCDGYITKPIRLADFPGQVKGFLRRESVVGS